MTAKEMFEELGYKYNDENNEIYYLKVKCYPDRLNTEYIIFKEIIFIDCEAILKQYKTNALCLEKKIIDFDITFNELKAIQKQMEELRRNNANITD